MNMLKRNPRKSSQRRGAYGFTLIELLIVMVILVLLASLVGPRLFGQLGGAKVKAARAQIEMMGAAFDGYRLDMSKYPTTEQGIAALSVAPVDPAAAAIWRGPYLKKPVERDPWGKNYITSHQVPMVNTSCHPWAPTAKKAEPAMTRTCLAGSNGQVQAPARFRFGIHAAGVIDRSGVDRRCLCFLHRGRRPIGRACSGTALV